MVKLLGFQFSTFLCMKIVERIEIQWPINFKIRKFNQKSPNSKFLGLRLCNLVPSCDAESKRCSTVCFLKSFKTHPEWNASSWMAYHAPEQHFYFFFLTPEQRLTCFREMLAAFSANKNCASHPSTTPPPFP